MTDDKDFKRLVRQRMAKTGERYSTARARLRPPGRAAMESLHRRSGLDGLGPHLEGRYGIRVKRLTELDVGVFLVDRDEGPPWVARVFPSDRKVEQAEEDARLLVWLADAGFPAERCAHEEPVSVLDGQAVLVTRYIPGTNARTDFDGRTLFALGELVGRLHALSGSPIAREAGAWHHISPNGGGVRADVDALLPLLDALEPEDGLDAVRGALRAVDGCAGLPEGLVHPDPCGANAIVSGGAPVLIDWTGAGRGPRVVSLGALLAGALHPSPGAPPSRDLRRVDAIIAGYRNHARLTDEEGARLPAAIAGGGIVLDCWTLLFQEVPARRVAGGIAARLETAERAAERAVEAFDLDEAELTGWYTERVPVQHPGQRELF